MYCKVSTLFPVPTLKSSPLKKCCFCWYFKILHWVPQWKQLWLFKEPAGQSILYIFLLISLQWLLEWIIFGRNKCLLTYLYYAECPGVSSKSTYRASLLHPRAAVSFLLVKVWRSVITFSDGSKGMCKKNFWEGVRGDVLQKTYIMRSPLSCLKRQCHNECFD